MSETWSVKYTDSGPDVTVSGTRSGARGHVKPAGPSAVIAMALLVSACSASTTAAPQPTTPINTLGPTATPPPTTPATTTPEPTATYTPDEQAAIAAFERFFLLGTEARSNSPGSEAPDPANYATSEAATDALAIVDAELADGIYWTGPTTVFANEVNSISESVMVISGCMTTDWDKRAREDDRLLISEGELSFQARASVERVGFNWLVSGVEVEEAMCPFE